MSQFSSFQQHKYLKNGYLNDVYLVLDVCICKTAGWNEQQGEKKLSPTKIW